MKWIGQHIYDLVARFRNDVYLEDLSTTTETNVLVVDSDGKVSKTTVITGDVTGVTAGSNITVTNETGPVPTVALSTNVDVAGTLDVTSLGTFDASVTVDGKISLNDGGNSIFVGYDAGLSDDASANFNVGVGYQALRANTTGDLNIANGAAALYSNTTGNLNTANGSYTLYANTTGGGNTANGYAALRTNTTGNLNTANGSYTLYANTAGSNNIAVGAAALYSNTTGDENIAVGRNAGAYITDGVTANTVTSNSVFLGTGTKALASSQTNQIVIGYDATGLGSNTAILGNSSITTTRLQGGIEINATDTTITRASAGRIAVEGVNVVTTSSIDTLENKTLTSPTLTTPVLGTPSSGDLTNCTFPTLNQSTTGNADTVTTNANLTGPVTSTGNATTIADGAITTAMQKHLQIFEFNGYLAGTDTNYYFPSAISNNTGPFKHTVLGGASGTTAITTQNLIRMGGKVMPYSGTVKLWKGWGTGNIAGSVTIGIFKYTPSATTPPSTSSVALALVDDTTFTAIAGTASSNSVIGFSESSAVVGFSAGDILMTGIKGINGMTVYFTSTLEVEWS